MKLLVPIMLTPFVPNVPKMFHDAAFLLKLLLLKADPWELGQGLVRVPDPEIHSELNIPCDTCLLSFESNTYALAAFFEGKSLLRTLDSSLKTDPCKTNPASYPYIPTHDR